MASSSIDNLRRLMAQYIIKVDNESTNEDLTCTICNNLVIDAYQTYCGCQYCRTCINIYMTDGDKYCRGNKKECKEEYLVLEKNVMRNVLLDRKMLKLKVHCPNKSCPCITELSQLQDHLRECIQILMECPFTFIGCDAERAPKEGISIHIRDDTLKHSQLLIELIHNLKNDISGLKEDFGVSKLEISSLMEQLRMKDVQIEGLKGEIMEQRRNTDTQDRKIENLKKDTNELRKEIANLKRESDDREIMLVGVKKEVAEVIEYSRNVKNTVERSERESTKYRSALTKIKAETEHFRSVQAIGQSSFTVDKFGARKLTEEVILSPYFDSHVNGYKLRLEVHPGGYDEGRGTHLSVYIRICRGEYDDVLPWPCRHTFTVSVIDQRDGGTHATVTRNYATAADNHRYTFDKPINDDNVSYGYPKFVSHANLQSVVGLTVDDCVIVRCVVSAPP